MQNPLFLPDRPFPETPLYPFRPVSDYMGNKVKREQNIYPQVQTERRCSQNPGVQKREG
jgi:hypothetical protein